MAKWFTDEEKQFIRENYEFMTAEAMGKHLGRKPHSVRGMIDRLGLKKIGLYSQDDLQDITEALQTMPVREVAEMFGLSETKLRNIMKYNNISAVPVHERDKNLGQKVCTQCGEAKSLDNYPLQGDGSGRFHPWCKQCRSEQGKEYRDANPLTEEQKRHRKNLYCLRNYGITLEESERRFEEQGKVCGMCGSDKPGWGSGWHQDHCHETGKARGVLCGTCNGNYGWRETFRAQIDAYDKKWSG